MKYFVLVSMITLLTSCTSGQKIFERKTSDNGKIIVKKGIFSGIHYIHFEKKVKRKIKYYMFYDCECDEINKMALRKGVMLDDGYRTLWNAVTDTAAGQPNFFGEAIAANRLYSPIEFIPIAQEEISLLEEGLAKVDRFCCEKPDRPISKIIGYIRVKAN